MLFHQLLGAVRHELAASARTEDRAGATMRAVEDKASLRFVAFFCACSAVPPRQNDTGTFGVVLQSE